jgi:chromate reductase
VLNRPEVMIAGAHTLFDDTGALTDETTKKFIRDLLDSLARWTRQLQAGSK